MPNAVAETKNANQNAMTPANIVTIIRICLVPVFLAVLLSSWPEWFGIDDAAHDMQSIVAAVIFILISCTDWLDGYLARSRGEVTDFGKFMDPLADKILVAAALIALVELGALPTWVVVLILAREFIVSGVRMMAAAKGEVIAASYIGKFKTVFQMIAIVLFTIRDSSIVAGAHPVINDNIYWFSDLIMAIALILTLVSMIDYLVKARDVIGLGKTEGKQEAAQGAQIDAYKDVNDLAECVIARGLERGMTVATAESLTGGLTGAVLTSIPGSSSVFKGGVLSYVDDVKHSVLNVDEHVLETDGAVSEQCAMQMAQGARAATGADIAVSMTGIAGPTGAEPGKPVGTVWIGFATAQQNAAYEYHFEGNRDAVRSRTVEEALKLVMKCFDDGACS